MNWYYYKRSLLPNIEIHKEIVISKKEIRFLLWRKKVLFLRYTKDFDQEKISPAYYIIKDSWGGFDELSANTRNQVRKALKMCHVKKIEKDTLLASGYDVYKSHSDNYKMNQTSVNYYDYIEMIKKMTDREIWGCFDDNTGKLIAYSQNIVGEGVQYALAKANPSYYKTHYPYYALFFKMTEYYLYECKKKYVSDGFRTLDNHSNIQFFLLEKFKFRKAYCKLYIHYNWFVKLIVAVVFPFRKFIKKNQIRNLLIQEEISRGSLNI